MSEPLAGQLIIGERSYEDALNLIIERAETELLIFDQDFSKGAYASIKRFDLICAFLNKSANTRLIIILQNSEAFRVNCPRLFQLLIRYSHKMLVYQTQVHIQSIKEVFVLADIKSYVRRFHIDHARFKFNCEDIATASLLHQRFEEMRQATSHNLSITTLGL